MKKMMAIVLMLVLVAGCAAAEDKGMAVQVNLNLNSDLALYLMQAGAMNTGHGLTDEQLDAAESLMRLLNGLSFYGEGDGNALRCKVLLNNVELFLLETDGQAWQTSMLPTYGLFLPEMNGSPAAEDQEQAESRLKSGMAALLSEMSRELESHLAEEGEGEYRMDALGGTLSFNHQGIYRFTLGELADAAEMFLYKAVALLQAYLLDMGIPENAVKLHGRVTRPEDEALLETPMQLTLHRQKTESGFAPHYFFGELTGNIPEKTTLQLALSGDAGEMALLSLGDDGEILTPVTAAWEKGQTEEEAYFTAQAMINGNWAGVDVRTCETMDGRKELAANLFAKSEDAPLMRLDAVLIPLDGLSPVQFQDKPLLNPADIGEEGSMALSADLQKGLNALLVNAVQAAPDEITVLLNLMTVQMQ